MQVIHRRKKIDQNIPWQIFQLSVSLHVTLWWAKMNKQQIINSISQGFVKVPAMKVLIDLDL